MNKIINKIKHKIILHFIKINNISLNYNFKKIFLIRGGECKNKYSPGTETMTQEEYTRAYENETNLDELDDINRLNRAYVKPKEKLIPSNKTGRTLKDKPISSPIINDSSAVDESIDKKPIIEEPINNKPIGVPIIEEPIIDKPVVDKSIIDDKKNDLINDNTKADYKNTKRIFDKRKEDFEKMKEEFQRNTKSEIKSKLAIQKVPLSFTNKEIFDNFVLKNKITIELISHLINLAIIYLYLRVGKVVIIREYKLIYINYKNKKYKNCIYPTVRLLIFLFGLLKIFYSGPRNIRFFFLKICYYLYIGIVFLKEKDFITNRISKFVYNMIYPSISVLNIYLFEDLFKYLHRLVYQLIDFSLQYLLHDPIGQIISHPLLTKALIKLRRYFFKDPLEVIISNIIESMFDIFFAHKVELRALLKMNRVFEEFKSYCFNNNKKDAIIDYVTNNKINLQIVSPLISQYKSDHDYFIKFNRFLCELYNIKKNYVKGLKFSNYKNFKSGTFLYKLFDNVSKFKFDDEIVRKESINLIEKEISQGKFQDSLHRWIYSPIIIANAYELDILELKKLFSIYIPEYIVNDKNFCRYLNYKEIIYKIFYKNIYKLFMYTSLIFSLFIFLIYLKQRVPKEIKNSILKKIENKKKSFSDFLEEIPARYIVLSISIIFLYIQYLKYVLNLLLQ